VALSVAVVVKIYYSDNDMMALRHLHLRPRGMWRLHTHIRTNK
jgi:hypothetical protein